ncbi:hypothetical protein [Phycicoccus endophyticus]|uniref:hypothetical protein n=1 Tax=Phycicoccus endophyticus TaxID=1690220 RepID=UPI0021D36804|nr:hypothetical protein [Phycicoccus endophyticus]
MWNVRDLPADSPVLDGLFPCSPSLAPPLPPGPVGADLVAGVPLGLLTAQHAAALADVARFVVVTPWRSVLVPDGAAVAGRLAQAGLVPDAPSAASRVSACVGAPYCAKGETETLPVAREVVRRLDAGTGGTHAPVHVVGCARRCGARSGDLVAVAPAGADAVLAGLGAQGA